MRCIARLALSSALLWLACSEVPQSGDRASRPRRSNPQALQAASGAQWNDTGDLIAARYNHTATLLPSGQVLVTGGGDLGSSFDSAEVYNPATGVWSPTGALATARSKHTATLLPSGQVLVTGGAGPEGPLASAEVYNPATGVWSPTGALATARFNHTATLLPSGQVLVTGGDSPDGPLASAEVYDPATGVWSTTGDLATARFWHTAMLLPSGQVLVTGGLGPEGSLASTEVYDPATGVWSPTDALATSRFWHTTTLLPSGQVLVTGGDSPDGPLASAEVYDPATGVWSTTSALATTRSSHTATLLPSGQVLITGGGASYVPLASAEVYNPATEAWSPTGALAAARSKHTATLLPSGQALIAGGAGPRGNLASAEVYNPATGAWSTTGALASARSSHTATLLPSGLVLIAGGGGSLASAEVYNPATGVWSTTGALITNRFNHTATLLPSGRVLVTGGFGQGGPLASTEVYDPATGTWSTTGALASARSSHTATLLSSGQVLVTGGAGPEGPLASAEVYNPATGVWSTTRTLAAARSFHTATLLPSGQVLVTGGIDPSRSPVSAEVYDPATEVWSLTGAQVTARSSHTATLLPSGHVLVTGGLDHRDTPLASAEVYDPATGAWNTTDALVATRFIHTATLLPSGQVLVTGGFDPRGNLASAEVYESTGVRLEWRPVITPPAEQRPGERFRITGSRLRGLSEASSGNTQNSATNLPVISFLALAGGKLTHVTALDSFSETEVSGPMPIVPNGYYILSVMANGIHGGQLVLVNGPPPSVPAITSPEDFANTDKPVIAGTAEPGSTVVVRLDGSVAGRTRAGAQGEWSLTPASALSEGVHRAVAIAMDSVGNISPESTEHSFKVDTVLPEAPDVIAPGDFVNTQEPAIAGTAEPGSTITVLFDDDETRRGTVEVNASGAWSFTPATALSEGFHQVRATAKDKAGNVSPPSVARSFTVDTVPPVAPVVTSPGDFVNASRPPIGGTAEARSVVTVSLGGTVVGTAEADSTGAWSFPTTTLPEGVYQVKAKATDAAGNVSDDSEELGFTVDIEPPVAPVVTSPEGSIDTRTPIIRGAVEPGSTVKVWLGANEASAVNAVVDPTGDWRFVPPSALNFGKHTVSAIAMDAAGNPSEPSQREFSIQRSHYGWSCTTAPAVPVTWALLLLALSLGRARKER